MRNLFLIAALFCLGAALYHWRSRILGPLRRFDQRNAARQREELLARVRWDAHYRETLKLAEEQVEPVMEYSAPDARTGVMRPRYAFMSEEFFSRAEAEEARNAAIAGKARSFYQDLDRQWLGPGPQQRGATPAPALPPPDLRPPRP